MGSDEQKEPLNTGCGTVTRFRLGQRGNVGYGVGYGDGDTDGDGNSVGYGISDGYGG